MTEPPIDVATGHRYFAVELNNLAWDLLEAAERSPADEARMLHAAHGACFHWLEVGTALHHQRAQCLLATAYVAAGKAEAAVRHGEQCVALSREVPDQTPFDLATAHGCASAAYAAAGRIDEARAEHALARAAADTFDDASERTLFDRLYPAP